MRSLAKSLASCALAVSVAAGGPALGIAAVLGAGAFALVPQSVWAEPVEATAHDISTGSLVITEDGNYTVSGTTATNNVEVGPGVTATITLVGVSVDLSGIPYDQGEKSAIKVSERANVTLVLVEGAENKLMGSPGFPGIHLPETAHLTIRGAGSLNVTGGSVITSPGGTGIGGMYSQSGVNYVAESCGTVVILDGNIIIKGGNSESGVGGTGIGGACGNGPHAPGSGGTVIILGGTVDVKGGNQVKGDVGNDIGGGKGAPGLEVDDGQGIRPVPGEANTYEVWGELALPEGVMIPEGAILTGEGSLAEGSKLEQRAPSAPTISNISQITDTSVTLTAVTGGKTQTHYAWVKGVAGEATPPARDSQWDPKLTIPDLMAATTYTFYARYCETDFYQASPASPGLTVVTAPSLSAVSINYEEETISFAPQYIEVSSHQDYSSLFDTGESITPHIARSLYMRAKVDDGAQASIRGVTTVSLPPRPNYADGITAVNASAEGVSDGKITGVSADMEYKKVDADFWTDCVGDTVENLAPGAYYVRTKAMETSFASLSKKVTIGVGEIVSIDLPAFDSVYSGYTQPDPKPIEIRNSSDEDAKIVRVSCTGIAFKIQPKPIQDLLKIPAHGTNAYYELRPEPGMAAGEYASPITVIYEDANGDTHSITAEAKFTVFPQMDIDVLSDEVKPDEEEEDWAPTVTYGDALEVVVGVSNKPNSGEEGSGGEAPGERAVSGPGAGEASDDPPAVPVMKGLVSLYLGDKLLAGPVAYEGGEITLMYDTRNRDIPVSDKAQRPTVVFEGENAPDATWELEFKLMKAPAAELAVRGDLVEGLTLEAGFPDARDNAGASFQWLRDGEPIAGATGQRYRLASEDVGHEVTVRATTPWFEGVSASAAHGDKVKPATPSEEVPPAGDTDEPTPGSPGEPAPNGNSGGSGLPSTGDPAGAIASAALAGAIAAATGAALARRRNG